GADIIAVIRSTAQSLLDYVPIGTTTTGFGGTWATRENFRVMRNALDEEEKARNKYIRLTNYSSGLCMSEIAVLAPLEDLDVLLGLGQAYEMDPSRKNSFLLELGQALLVKECFPKNPLKYMPPTRHMTGDIFFGHVYDSFFSLVTVWAGQTTQLLGIPTEAI